MIYLVAITILWAFSFSLIGTYLAGQVDAYFSVLTRVTLAAAVFLPFIRRVPLSLAAKLMVLGAIQLGCMYVFYYQSFLLLTVPEVLIFTILTPDLCHPHFRFNAGAFQFSLSCDGGCCCSGGCNYSLQFNWRWYF